MKKITILLLMLTIQLLQASNYNYKIGAEYSQSVNITDYVESIPPTETEPPPVPVLGELIINPNSSLYGGGNIDILTDLSELLPSNATETPHS